MTILRVVLGLLLLPAALQAEGVTLLGQERYTQLRGLAHFSRIVAPDYALFTSEDVHEGELRYSFCPFPAPGCLPIPVVVATGSHRAAQESWIHTSEFRIRGEVSAEFERTEVDPNQTEVDVEASSVAIIEFQVLERTRIFVEGMATAEAQASIDVEETSAFVLFQLRHGDAYPLSEPVTCRADNGGCIVSSHNIDRSVVLDPGEYTLRVFVSAFAGEARVLVDEDYRAASTIDVVVRFEPENVSVSAKPWSGVKRLYR